MRKIVGSLGRRVLLDKDSRYTESKMSTSQLDHFAKALVQHVRDEAIRNIQVMSRSQCRTDWAQRWRDVSETDATMAAIVEVIPDIVDKTICQLLRAIDSGDVPLHYVDGASHVDIGSIAPGELVGMFMASEGWRSKYSSERITLK